MSWRQDQLSWDLFLNFLPLPSSGEGRHKPLLGRWVETTVSKMESPAVIPETGPRAMPDASSSLGQSHRIMAATMGTRWDITTSITVPHPDTSAPAPAEQHHPLFQMTPPECNWSRHRAPWGASSRSLPAFDSLQQVLPICTAASLPALGYGLWSTSHRREHSQSHTSVFVLLPGETVLTHFPSSPISHLQQWEFSRCFASHSQAKVGCCVTGVLGKGN